MQGERDGNDTETKSGDGDPPSHVVETSLPRRAPRRPTVDGPVLVRPSTVGRALGPPTGEVWDVGQEADTDVRVISCLLPFFVTSRLHHVLETQGECESLSLVLVSRDTRDLRVSL